MIERTVFRERRPDLVSQAAIRHLIDLYDEEIAYFDEQLARLLDALEERGLLDDTLVVLTADHGEEFLEHGSVAHCRTTYDTETRIPLVFWAPGRPGGRIATPVENPDVVPTILDFLAVEPPPGMDGKSLRPWIERREQPGSGVARSLQTNLRSIDDGRYKLIFDLGTGKRQVYDLVNDPGETVDLSAHPPEEAAALEARLHAWIREHEEELAKRHGRDYGRRIEQGLRALGYIE